MPKTHCIHCTRLLGTSLTTWFHFLLTMIVTLTNSLGWRMIGRDVSLLQGSAPDGFSMQCLHYPSWLMSSAPPHRPPYASMSRQLCSQCFLSLHRIRIVMPLPCLHCWLGLATPAPHLQISSQTLTAAALSPVPALPVPHCFLCPAHRFFPSDVRQIPRRECACFGIGFSAGPVFRVGPLDQRICFSPGTSVLEFHRPLDP